jgi:ribonuclease P protein component
MPGGLARLKKRADFLRVAAARRAVARPGVVLQAAHQPIGMAAAAADAVLPRVGRMGTDYVLIARAGTSHRHFADLVGDIEAALHRIARDTPLRRGGEIRNGG